ncbi:eukaryotic rRNA processing protein EBP2-domain-containing protein [Lipomyces oligophaga]|uniref:eukaryotic rRNA processing protein EBP2-domain-containing protein n=1 Tax=Lipomyces oligophaga TaxID=45792 RepID=UPI0034CF391D
MVRVLKAALARAKGVDIESRKLKKVEKQRSKLKMRRKPSEASKVNGAGGLSNSKGIVKVIETKKEKEVNLSKNTSGTKSKRIPVEEDPDEIDEEQDGLDVEEDDSSEYEEEDFSTSDEELKKTLARMIDTTKLEDDLSSDSESDDEDALAMQLEMQSSLKPRSKFLERKVVQANGEVDNTEASGQYDEDDHEDGIPLSDVPTESELDSSDSDSETYSKRDIVPYQKLTVNNLKALSSSLSRIILPYNNMPFSEHMVVQADSPLSVSANDVDNDLQRELAFYNQALDAAMKGRAKLIKDKVAFTRPEDYFAEMVKTDLHMEKLARHHTTLAAQGSTKSNSIDWSGKKSKSSKSKSKAGPKPAGSGKSAISGKPKKPRHK